MTNIPNFQNAKNEDTYTTIFTNKLNDYVMFMTAVKGKFLPNYEWDQITGETLTVIRDITTSLLYDTDDEFEEQNPSYKRKDSVFVTYTTIFTNKLNDYVMFMTAVKDGFFPNYKWDQITGETLTVIRDITNFLLYDTTDEFEEQNPLYKRKDSVFVPRNELFDAVKEAVEGVSNRTTILGDK